jgi:hypothetical protein
VALGPLPCGRADGDGMNRQAGMRAVAQGQKQKHQVNRPILTLQPGIIISYRYSIPFSIALRNEM